MKAVKVAVLAAPHGVSAAPRGVSAAQRGVSAAPRGVPAAPHSVLAFSRGANTATGQGGKMQISIQIFKKLFNYFSYLKFKVRF